MKKKYFHELSDKSIIDIIKGNLTISELMQRYEQPSWCSYPQALEGRFGCWSLLGLWGTKNRIRCEKDCINCDCYKRKK